jgi:hypothetical protein
MPSPRRTTWVFLLLAILVGHASLALHFNSHVAVEQQGCEICTHYSNFEHAVPPLVTAAPVAATHAPALVAPAALPATAEASPYHQRAPPPAA